MVLFIYLKSLALAPGLISRIRWPSSYKEVPKENSWQAEATKVRQEEHAEYLKSSKDFKDSAAAVAKAIDVLNEYYSSASFVQASSLSRPLLRTPA